MLLPRLNPCFRVALMALTLIAALSYWFMLQRGRTTDSHIIQAFDNESQGSRAAVQGNIQFWREFQPLLTAYGPQCNPPERDGMAESTHFTPASPLPRPDLLRLPIHDILRMKKAHKDFVEVITANAPKLLYVPGTRGIVTTAGGSYLPVMVISLRMLRRTGSQLPVEVFLADRDEYEEYVCDEVLPFLMAKCVVLSEILNAVPGVKAIEKYQFKPFAMLFSSFEDILFLDADAFPIYAPDPLFDAEPYTSKHMVTWPDFWASSASPIYFEIASQEVPPMNLRQSTESGEILLSKKTHSKTLLLSTYYNFWGPSHYYPLFSQGAAGEGDKETFLAAATAVGDPFYQVSEPLRALGHDPHMGSAMVQFDPTEDFALTQRGEWRVSGSDAPSPRPLFIHANFPKFDPATVFNNDHAVRPTFNDDGSYTRAWLFPEETVEAFGYDVEKQFWKEIVWAACHLEYKFKSWKNETDVCADAKKYWYSMFGP